MRFRLLVLVVIIMFPSFVLKGEEFRLVEKWEHGEIIHGNFLNALIDKDGELIVMTANYGVKIANEKKIRNFAPKGQGPGDILYWTTLCKYEKGMIADVELHRKIQIFNKENGKYKWYRSFWREEKNCLQFPHSVIYLDSKWIVGGSVIENNNSTFKEQVQLKSFFFVRILNSSGKFIRKLVRRDLNGRMPIYLKTFLNFSKSYIFVLIEDEMTAYIISRKDYKKQRSIRLMCPEFYKKIPDETYVISNRKKSKQKAKFQFQKWKMSYSSISNIAIYNKELIVQIRTANSKLKTFALLFYDISKRFNLKRMFYTNDLLLAVNKEKLYFLANGDPAIDDDAGDFNINIYEIDDSKK